ncbi:S49 family peptidase [Candidatus Berkiella aquae]|uniref:Putative signal peptide peptidase SppA n=1 Tax=Candidatus Berkiella aquae TaxID=295108 RepID=A0A0Q9YZ64_9GAMM|nr:S49 family peptidase [Candidatus Berkiella aquae]MCS5711782.1 S49 family peptidase [Candidatus Berkiella aquae]
MQDQVEKSPQWERDVLEKALTASVTEHRRSRRWSIFFKLIILAYVIFLTTAWYQGKAKPVLKDHVALIDVIGTIGQGQEVDADQVATSLHRAFNEPKVKGIILRINSPGGTPVQSAYIYDELKRQRALHPDKKVYAVAVDICASGAYYVAAGADQIYANKSSIIGSIGVLMPGFGFVDIMKKVGVEQRSMSAGKNKLFMDPFSPVKPEQVEFTQALLDDVHSHFINAVKEGRGSRLKPNNEVFTGLFWTGDKALEMGLIDGIGSSGFVAREVIGVNEVIDYTTSHSLLDRLASRIGSSFSKQLSSELGISSYSLR